MTIFIIIISSISSSSSITIVVDFYSCLGESSFNMTRGKGDEDIEGGLRNFLDTRKGGSSKIRGAPKICILQNQQEGGY